MRHFGGIILFTLFTQLFPCNANSQEVDSRNTLTPSQEQMFVHLDSLWATGQRKPVVAILDSLIRVTPAEQAPLYRVNLLNHFGARLLFFGRVIEAEPTLREAMVLAESLENSLALCIAVRYLGLVIEKQGHPAEAREQYERLRDLARACGDQYHEGLALIGIGNLDLRQGDLTEAVRVFEQATILFGETGNIETQIWAHNSLGNALNSQGKTQRAMENYQQALRLAREANQAMSEAFALNNIGTLEYRVGDPRLALQSFHQAYDIHKNLGILRDAIPPGINIALCQSNLGRYDDAETMLEACLQDCRDQGYRDLEAGVLIHLARLRSEQGFHHDALRRYREVFEQGEQVSFERRINSLTGAANELSTLDDLAGALSISEEAMILFGDRRNHHLWPKVKLRHGKCLFEVGRLPEALEHLTAGAEAAREQEQLLQFIEGLSLAARIARQLGSREQAAQFLDEAAEAWEASRALTEDPEWREQRGTLGRLLYAEMAGLLLSDEMSSTPAGLGEIFDRLQVFKARTLLERMLGPIGTLAVSDDEITMATLNDLQQQILRPGELFLDAYLGETSSYLFAITCDTSCVVTLPTDSGLEARLQRYHELLSLPPGGDSSFNLSTVASVAKQIYELLFSDLTDLLAENRQVIISPDGALNLVPFASLQPETRESDIEWTCVPSATILSRLRAGPRFPRVEGVADTSPTEILIFAAPEGVDGQLLTGALAEVRTLASRYRHVTARIVLPAEMPPQASDLCEAYLLHFASHAQLDDQNPWQSEIQFGPAGTGNALSAAEIAGLDLRADLAVLSSCSSAGGRILSGEGVLGLSSAFLSAGVPAVVATLWPVDDATTTLFMAHLYNYLSRGETVAAAVAQARRLVRQESKTAHAFYWAGFVVIGDGGIRIELERKTVIPMWTIIALALVAVGLRSVLLRARRLRT